MGPKLTQAEVLQRKCCCDIMQVTLILKGLCFMKTYTIVAGVNGCGKSSLTGVLRTEIDNLGKIIDVDKITAACGGNLLEGGKKA